MGVEQTVCLVAVGGIFEVLFVDCSNLFVVLSGTHLEARVVTIETAGTHRDDFIGLKRKGLTSTIDATAGASHDFDDVIFLLAGANHFADFVDVSESEDLAETELDAGDFDFGFADAFAATEGFEIEAFGFLASEFFGGEADDGFGHTTGCAVDNASTGFEAHRIVAGFVRQTVEVNAEFTNEVGQFSVRHGDIDIADTVVAEFIAGNFEFLGRARHDGNDEDVLVVLANFFGKDATEDGSTHFLRGFAAGEMSEHILFVFFGVFDPCGAARREDGQIFAFGHAAEDFGAFFDCRKIGGESGIADEVEAEAMHGGNHFTHDGGARFEAEFFAQAHADSRRNLSHDESIGIVDSCHDFVIVAVADDGTCRADGGTLTAVHAIDFSDGQTKSRLNDRIVTAFSKAEDADALNFGASADAVAAEDAFAGIADE